jgi:hypothetical protein
MNNGDGTFTPTQAIKLERNLWSACFVDLNHNGYPDLVCAVDKGPITIFRNNGTEWIKTELEHQGFWMGIGIGYIAKDEYPSLFFTNRGDRGWVDKIAMKALGLHMGDIPKGFTKSHVLLRAGGDYKFKSKEVSKGDGFVGGKKAFGWGAIFHDWNLDGNQDLLFSAGFKELPWNKYQMTREPCMVYKYNDSAMWPADTFVQSYKFKNNEISHSPIALDIDGDGYDEIIWLNHFAAPTCYKPPNRPKVDTLNVIKSATNANQRHYGKQLILGGTGQGIGETGNITRLM